MGTDLFTDSDHPVHMVLAQAIHYVGIQFFRWYAGLQKIRKDHRFLCTRSLLFKKVQCDPERADLASLRATRDLVYVL